jgi:catechol 2,3-dioxygenase-like lactoylglutathione lyase family enzyme
VLDYTGVRVRDLDRARQFYCTGLGLRSVASGRTAAGGRWEMLEDPSSSSRLELNFYPDAPAYREGDELDHLGFTVRDLESTVATLVRLGGRVRIPSFEESGVRKVFLSDPDGVWVELREQRDPDAPPTSQVVD